MIRAIREDAISCFTGAGLLLGVIAAITWFLVALDLEFHSRYPAFAPIMRFVAPFLLGFVIGLLCVGLGELCESVIDRTRYKDAASTLVVLFAFGGACSFLIFAWTIVGGIDLNTSSMAVGYIGSVIALWIVGPSFAALGAVFCFLIVARIVQWLLGHSRMTKKPSVQPRPWPPSPEPSQPTSRRSKIIYVDRKGVAAIATTIEEYYALRLMKPP